MWNVTREETPKNKKEQNGQKRIFRNKIKEQQENQDKRIVIKIPQECKRNK